MLKYLEKISTKIQECVAGDDDLNELYSFFSLDAIETFEATLESELSQYMTGYYDWADLRYLMISGEGRVSDGVRHYIYSNDPIEMVVKWMRKTAPFKLDVYLATRTGAKPSTLTNYRFVLNLLEKEDFSGKRIGDVKT